MKHIQENGSERGIGGCDFEDWSDRLLARDRVWTVKVLGVLDMKHAKELDNDFNNDVFSRVCSVVDDPDEIALSVREEIQGESEFLLPSSPVNEAKTRPVTVAGDNRSIQKGAWYQTMQKEMQRLIESKPFTAVDELPHRKNAVGSRWVLSNKSDTDGLTTKTKARSYGVHPDRVFG